MCMGLCTNHKGNRICAQFHLSQEATVSIARMHFWNVHQGKNSKGLTKSVIDSSHHLLRAGLEAGSSLRRILAALRHSPVDVVERKTKLLPALAVFLQTGC